MSPSGLTCSIRTRRHCVGSGPRGCTPRALGGLLEPTVHEDEPRPKLEGHGDYVFGALLVPVAVPEEDRVSYQEVGLLLTEQLVLTVRKTPPEGAALDLSGVHETCRAGMSAGMVAYNIVDQVAEGYLDLVDDLHGEIDELEDHVEEWTNET